VRHARVDARVRWKRVERGAGSQRREQIDFMPPIVDWAGATSFDLFHGCTYFNKKFPEKCYHPNVIRLETVLLLSQADANLSI
jgi:hypothetical protein